MSAKSPEPPFSIADISEAKDVKHTRAMLDAAERTFAVRKPVYTLLAKERFAQFEAYQAVGFDATQSLRLIIAELMRPQSAT